MNQNRLQAAIRRFQPIRVAVSGSRWTVWAKQLVARYGAGLPVWNAPNAVTRRTQRSSERSGDAVNVLHQYHYHALDLRLHLSIPAAREQLAQDKAATPDLNFPAHSRVRDRIQIPVPYAVETLVTRLQKREQTSLTREHDLVTRVLAHRRREGQVNAETEAWTAAPPVPRIVNQPVAVVAATAQTKAASLSTPPGMAYWENTRGPMPVPPMDVERLTDQVLHSIDQRLVAARERLGKR